jgi:tRNA modification GTPase
LRESEDPIEAIGIGRAAALIEAADIVVWLGPAADAPEHARLIQVQSKADLLRPSAADRASLAVSAATGQGIAELLGRIEKLARDLLPAEDGIALNRRQAAHVEEAAAALLAAASAAELVVVAEELRIARAAFDRLTGRAGVEEVLDALFGRFCLGK